MLSTWTSLVNKSVTVSPLREDWDLLWHCQKTPLSGPRIVPSLPSISLQKRALFQGLLGTDGLFSQIFNSCLRSSGIVLLQRALPLMFFLKREFRLAFTFSWNGILVIHVLAHVIRQWTRVWIAFKVTSPVTILKHCQVIFLVFSLYSSGDKNEQQSSTWEHVLHVI